MMNPFAFLIVVLLLMLSSAILSLSPDNPEKCSRRNEKKVEQAQKNPQSKLSWSEFMTKKVAPLNRLERVNLFPEEGPPVIIPTVAYLNRLEASIQENWLGNRNEMIVRRIECERLLDEVREGYQDITSRINPVYGRPIFTKDQLGYIRWSERRITDLLRSLEYGCTRLTSEERQSIAF